MTSIFQDRGDAHNLKTYVESVCVVSRTAYAHSLLALNEEENAMPEMKEIS
jgi:hypothetical protein